MLDAGMNIKDKKILGIGKVLTVGFGLKGHIKLDLYDENGNLKDSREESNTVTTLALALMADAVAETPAIATPGWMELGTGSGQGAGDTTLATYISGSRTAVDSAVQVAAVCTYICTFAAGTGTGAITEAGLFNVVTQDTTDLILYDDFAVINKGAGDSLVITWTLTFAAL
jgi:hypothetical protein